MNAPDRQPASAEPQPARAIEKDATLAQGYAHNLVLQCEIELAREARHD